MVTVFGDEQPAVLAEDPDGVALLRGVVELLATELLSPQGDLLELLVVVPGPLQLLREIFEVHAHGDKVDPGPGCNQGKIEEGGYLQDGRSACQFLDEFPRVAVPVDVNDELVACLVLYRLFFDLLSVHRPHLDTSGAGALRVLSELCVAIFSF